MTLGSSRRPAARHTLRTGLTIVAIAAAVSSAALFIAQRVTAGATPQGSTPRTVVVLGARVHGRRPGRQLTARLDAALAYLADDPDSPVIVTGAGAAERTEAAVMRDHLVAHGIDPLRIAVEPHARNTAENIAYAARLIDEGQLPREIVIVTSDFHQLRAAIHAARAGLAAAHISAPTPWRSYLTASIREQVIIVSRGWLPRAGVRGQRG